MAQHSAEAHQQHPAQHLNSRTILITSYKIDIFKKGKSLLTADFSPVAKGNFFDKIVTRWIKAPNFVQLFYRSQRIILEGGARFG